MATNNIEPMMATSSSITRPQIKFTRCINSKKDGSDDKTKYADTFEEYCKKFKDCFEVIPDEEDVIIKPYFDIDYTLKEDEEYDEFCANYLLFCAMSALLLYFKDTLEIPSLDFAVAHAHGQKNKDNGSIVQTYSFHINILNINTTKKTLERMINKINTFEFIQEIRKELQKVIHIGKEGFFDESVYKNKNKMRCVHCCKIQDAHRPLKLISVDTFTSFIKDKMMSAPQWEPAVAYHILNECKISDKFDDMLITAFTNQSNFLWKVAKPTEPAVTRTFKVTGKSETHSNTKYEEMFINLAIEKGIMNKFAEEYQPWITIGWVLKNTFDDAKGWELFDAFSALTQKNGNYEIRNKYDQFKNREYWDSWKSKSEIKKPVSMGTLKNMIKEEKEYLQIYKEINKEIQEEKCKDIGSYMNWDLSGEAEFAKKFKEISFNDSNIIFVGKQKSPQGFLFNGIYWEELSLHGAELLKDKFDVLYRWYCEQLDKLKTLLPQDKEEEGYKEKHKEFTALEKRVKTLNEYHTRLKIIGQFKADCYMGDNVQWNRNPDLFVFEDCIYDLSKGAFVQPNPDDYMNISCGKKYNVDVPPEEIIAAKTEIDQIITSMLLKEDKKYVLKTLSSFLRQGNREEKAYFWLGRGRNGKGTLSELIKMVFGYYWGELNMDYYTSHSEGPDRPNQNLYNCRNARVVNSTESDDKNKYNTPQQFVASNFKRLTGNDDIYARAVGTGITATFKGGTVLIQTNIMPGFSRMTISLKERIVVINFPYTFTDDAQLLAEDPTQYKKKDDSLKEKFKQDKYRIAFTEILFETYKEYLEEFSIPTSVRKFTDSYFAGQSVKSWIQQNCEKTERKSDRVYLKTIQSQFQTDTDKKFSVKDLREALEEEGYTFTKSQGDYKLNGYKLKETKDEEDDDEECDDNETS